MASTYAAGGLIGGRSSVYGVSGKPIAGERFVGAGNRVGQCWRSEPFIERRCVCGIEPITDSGVYADEVNQAARRPGDRLRDQWAVLRVPDTRVNDDAKTPGLDDKGLDVHQVLAASIGEQQRLSGEQDAAALEKAFNIKTIRQLGSNKFFAVAAALVTLEEAG
jgi:hypothetical protein